MLIDEGMYESGIPEYLDAIYDKVIIFVSEKITIHDEKTTHTGYLYLPFRILSDSLRPGSLQPWGKSYRLVPDLRSPSDPVY